MKILVTGSSGMIGTRLCEKLLETQHEVIGVDKVKNTWSSAVNKITLIGNLLQDHSYFKIPTDVDLIVHLAANARVYDLVVDPNLARDNFEMSFKILEFARKNNIDKVMFSSSREVYGNTKKFECENTSEEETHVSNMESPYAATKFAVEALIKSYQKCYGINYVMFRFSNVYGMYDNSDRVIPEFFRNIKNKKDLVVYGKDKSLDFTYIDDVIIGVIDAIHNFDFCKNDTYNLAYGSGISLIDLAELMIYQMQSKCKYTVEDSRVGEVIHYIGNIDNAKKKLKYSPITNIRQGIEMMVKNEHTR